MNSLLQVLFNDSNFRKASFDWSGDNPVGLQLQHLLARMQVSPLCYLRPHLKFSTIHHAHYFGGSFGGLSS